MTRWMNEQLDAEFVVSDRPTYTAMMLILAKRGVMSVTAKEVCEFSVDVFPHELEALKILDALTERGILVKRRWRRSYEWQMTDRGKRMIPFIVVALARRSYSEGKDFLDSPEE